MDFDEWIKGQKSIRLDFKLIDLRRDAYNAGAVMQKEKDAMIVEFVTGEFPLGKVISTLIAKAIRES